MKSTLMLLTFLIYSSAVGVSDFAYAKTLIADPNIPNGETITYTSRVGDKVGTVVEKVVIKKEGEKELYEITSYSSPLDRTIVIEKDTMAVVSVHTVRKYQEVTLDSHLKVIDEKEQLSSNVIKLADFTIMNYLFRGFPFGKREKLKIGSYREEQKDDYPLNVICKKPKRIEVNGRTIECYKLELGMDGFWGRFFPKTNMWYSVEPPHYLVRYKGQSGRPGSPKRVVELEVYTVPE
jgi:hypothetical protein